MSWSRRRTLQVVRHTATDSKLVAAAINNAACQGCRGCTGATSHPVDIDLQKSDLIQHKIRSLQIGQTVELELPEAMLLALSSVVYLLPVLLMLFFTVCCDLLFAASEAQIAASAFVGLGLGLACIVFLVRRCDLISQNI